MDLKIWWSWRENKIKITSSRMVLNFSSKTLGFEVVFALFEKKIQNVEIFTFLFRFFLTGFVENDEMMMKWWNDDEMMIKWLNDDYDEENFKYLIFFLILARLFFKVYIRKKVQHSYLMGLKIWWSWGQENLFSKSLQVGRLLIFHVKLQILSTLWNDDDDDEMKWNKFWLFYFYEN